VATAPRKRAPAPTAHLSARGRALWNALHRDVRRDAATDALVLEACRIADRLDRLDAMLRGSEDEWLRFQLPSEDAEIVLTVNPVLAECRQQATALQRLLDKLQTKPEPAAKGPDALEQLLTGDGPPAPASQ
jgi:hypothetical protein